MRLRSTALVVALAVCATAVPAGCSTGPEAVPDACPRRWGGEGVGGWVPAAADVDGAGESLVPGSPVRALICAYPGSNTDPGGERLAGSRTLTDQVAVMARDLAYLPVTSGEPSRRDDERHGPDPLVRRGGPDRRLSGGDVAVTPGRTTADCPARAGRRHAMKRR
ncbi:hypothetical protein [Microbispora sp. H10836]|uniref:hypothetical protein n=1 Tax=Microbispora sp. H10836 TaxID=2729106 RepID=UPI0014731FF6|nr:hypothetical protein [Microbispora sp. H10836]